MSIDHQRRKELFDQAVELTESERTTFLRRACGENTALRLDVEAMLANDPGVTSSIPEADHSLSSLQNRGASDRSDGAVAEPLFEENESIGEYTIIEPLGDGGMGSVYRAQQQHTNRFDALKFILGKRRHEEKSQALFAEEIRKVAKLNHPGIGQLYSPGWIERGGTTIPYFAMELIPGSCPITDWANHNDLDRLGRVTLFKDACGAVAYAHSRGIFHCDLKPLNMLVNEEGQPKLIDFGLAIELADDDGSDQRISGGTPQYMAPEQTDPATEGNAQLDVYTLGVILYQLIVNKVPYTINTTSNTTRIESIRNAEVPDVPMADRFDRDLNAVIQKATAREPGDRYTTVTELEVDLGHLMRDEPVEACDEHVRDKLARFTRKNRSLVSATCATFAILIVATMVSAWSAIDARNARDAAENDRAQTEEKRIEARNAQNRAEERLTVLAVDKALRAAQNFDPNSVRRQLALVQDVGREDRFDVGFVNAMSDQSIGSPDMDFVFDPSFAFSPDEKVGACASRDGTIYLFDMSTQQQIGEPLKGQESVHSIDFSPDGMLLASGTDQGIVIWNVITRQPTAEPLGDEDAFIVAFSPDGSKLASKSRKWDSSIRLWNPTNGQQIGEPLMGMKYISSIAFSPDGLTLACGDFDGRIYLWNLTKSQQVGEPLQRPESVRIGALAFSPDGSVLASATSLLTEISVEENTIDLWDIKKRQLKGKPLRGHADMIESIAFNPEGSLLASASRDKTIRLWNVLSCQQIGEALRGHGSEVLTVAFNHDGLELMTGDLKGTVRLWDVLSANRINQPLEGHDGTVKNVAFKPDGSMLASASYDKTIRLWDVPSGQQSGEALRGNDKEEFTSVTFSPDGSTLAGASTDGTICRWDSLTRQQIGEPIRGHDAGVISVSFSPDGSTLLSMNQGKNTIRHWNITTGEMIDELTNHVRSLLGVAFNPDGTILAWGEGSKGNLQLWNASEGRQIIPRPHGPTSRGQDKKISFVAINPSRSNLASTNGETICLWDVSTGKQIGEPLYPDNPPNRLAFSPDGSVLVSADKSGNFRLWDITTQQPIGETLGGHEEKIMSIAFSPDSSVMATSSLDKTIRLWHAVPLRERIDAIRTRQAELESHADVKTTETVE